MKKAKRIMGLLLALALVITILPMQTQAAKPKLNATKVTIYEGKTFYLKLQNSKASKKWYSSNKNVATVNKYGIVKAKKKGIATITCKSSGKKYKCKITVKAMPTVADLATTEYTFENGYSTRHIIAVTNNSSETIRVFSNSVAYDASGSFIGAASDTSYAIGPNCTSVLSEYYSDVKGVARFETKYKVELETYYKSVLQDLSYEYNPMSDKLIMQVTNNGSMDAKYVEATILFFKGDTVVNCEEEYFTGLDYSTLAAGETLTEQIEWYEDIDYDKIEVFFTGRCY